MNSSTHPGTIKVLSHIAEETTMNCNTRHHQGAITYHKRNNNELQHGNSAGRLQVLRPCVTIRSSLWCGVLEKHQTGGLRLYISKGRQKKSYAPSGCFEKRVSHRRATLYRTRLRADPYSSGKKCGQDIRSGACQKTIAEANLLCPIAL